MRGSVFKRCTCPVRLNDKGRKITCGKQHGSWSDKVDLPVTRLSVNAHFDQWLVSVRPTLEVAAWSNYRMCIDRYARPFIEAIDLAKLTGAMLSAHYASLIDGGGRNGRTLSPTTVRTVHRVLNKAFGDAVRDDLLMFNPALKAVPPKRRRYEATVWTAEQAMRFLTAMREDPLYAAWLVALSCGLRRGELAGLRWIGVDLDRATLRVTTQRTTDAGYNVIIKGRKGTGRRTIDLGAGTVAALRAHRDAQQVMVAHQEGQLFALEPSLEALPEKVPTCPKRAAEYVLLSEELEPIHPQRLTELFQKAAKAAGVPVIRLHDARHSCATLTLESGVHPKVVQQLLGHSSWSTTMDLYAHRVDRLQREATQLIVNLMLPPKEGSDGSGVAATG